MSAWTGGYARERPAYPAPASPASYDAIIVGSGFGGSLAAHALLDAGWRVLMLERGENVRRGPHLWAPEGAVTLSPYYSTRTPYRVRGDNGGKVGCFECVGGPSVFYGAASLRLREQDFEVCPGLHNDEGARWPFDYGEMEPFYLAAERTLGVAGGAARDPTGPARSGPYPQSLPGLCRTSQRVWDASLRLGLNPFRMPVAVNFSNRHSRTACTQCGTCDGYACAIDAKNDPAGSVLPDLIRRGLDLRAGMVVTRILRRGRRIEGVECVDKHRNQHLIFRGETVILAAGALGSPHLVLASGLTELSPAPEAVGRFLMRHCNSMVFGLFPESLGGEPEFRKQVGIHDFYFGDPAARRWKGKLGSIQQVQGAPVGLVAERLPPFLRRAAPWISDRITGLLAIAEDEPQIGNGVTLSRRSVDRFGLPQGIIHHRYTHRDLCARRTLVRRARRILKEAGAALTFVFPITTFSHAVGTLRMGEDPWTSPLDPGCRFRGTENLYVIDGSFMPTSGGVNPSLTIAANALRAATRLADEPARIAVRTAALPALSPALAHVGSGYATGGLS